MKKKSTCTVHSYFLFLSIEKHNRYLICLFINNMIVKARMRHINKQISKRFDYLLIACTWFKMFESCDNRLLFGLTSCKTDLILKASLLRLEINQKNWKCLEFSRNHVKVSIFIRNLQFRTKISWFIGYSKQKNYINCKMHLFCEFLFLNSIKINGNSSFMYR